MLFGPYQCVYGALFGIRLRLTQSDQDAWYVCKKNIVDVVDLKFSLSGPFCVSSHPSHFTTMEGFPITHATGVWMGPRLIHTFGRRNILPLLANGPQYW